MVIAVFRWRSCLQAPLYMFACQYLFGGACSFIADCAARLRHKASNPHRDTLDNIIVATGCAEGHVCWVHPFTPGLDASAWPHVCCQPRGDPSARLRASELQPDFCDPGHSVLRVLPSGHGCVHWRQRGGDGWGYCVCLPTAPPPWAPVTMAASPNCLRGRRGVAACLLQTLPLCHHSTAVSALLILKERDQHHGGAVCVSLKMRDLLVLSVYLLGSLPLPFLGG